MRYLFLKPIQNQWPMLYMRANTGARLVYLLIWLIFLGLIALAVYSPGARIDYYADDYQWYFDPPPTNTFYYFLHKNPYIGNAYRPLQAAFLILVQRSVGLDTLPIHIAQISLHVLLSWLIFGWMVNQGWTWLQAGIASLIMLVSQANAMAVLSNDTLSQICGTLFGCLGLFLFQRSLCSTSNPAEKQTGNGTSYFLSVLAFALSLLSKETSVSFAAILCLVVLMNNSAKRRPISLLLFSISRIIPFLLLVISYWIIRGLLDIQGPASDSGRYGFHIGLNIVKNLAMFAFQAFLPGSSVDAFVALRQRETITLLGILSAWFIFVLATLYGLVRSNRKALSVLLGLFTVMGLFPVVLLNKVSELYLYNSMPFVSVLIGIGIGKLVELSGSKQRALLTILVGVLFLTHILAVHSKTSLMIENGERSTVLLPGIEAYIQEVPQGGQLVLANPSSSRPEYSVFLMNGFDVLDGGSNRLYQLAGRSDFEVKLVPQADLAEETLSDKTLVLSLDKLGMPVRIRTTPLSPAY